MAENERFEIKKVVKPKECDGCEFNWETCEITCLHNCGQCKTREEYESIVLKAIDFELNKILNGVSNITNIQVAKAVCDTLFGKSK